MLSLSILAGIGFSKIKTKYRKEDLLAIFIILISIGYIGIPINSYASSLLSPTHIPKIFYEINNLTENFTVLMLPDEPLPINEPAKFIGLADYYVTAMQKPIISGYVSRTNASENATVTMIPLSNIASILYDEQLENVSKPNILYVSPMLENYTSLANLIYYSLAATHTYFVVILNNAYNGTYLYGLQNYLFNLFGAPVYESQNVTVYATLSALNKYAYKSLIIENLGNWYNGYYLCQLYNIPCNATIKNAWFPDYKYPIFPYIGIYAPNQTKASISFMAFGLLQNITAKITITGINGYEKNFNMNFTEAPRQYFINATLPYGISYLYIYPINGEIGIWNISIRDNN